MLFRSFMEKDTVVITGGEGDLAQEIARQFRLAGYEVLAPSRAALNVRDPQSVNHYFAGLSSLAILVNNAGMVADVPMLKMEEATWQEVVETNLSGAFLCARHALPLLLAHGSGLIINIGSYSALYPSIGQCAYAAAKAGLLGLTQSLAREHGPSQVRVNAVLPGFLETKMSRAAFEKNSNAILEAHALGKLNTVEDAAKFMVMLAEMRHVSGQVFQLDSRVTPWT